MRAINDHLDPPIVKINNPRIRNYLARSPILLEHMSFWYPLLDPNLTAQHSNIVDQLK